MDIGIIGLGLMGGSLAYALKDKHRIYAYDTNKDSLDFALASGMIDQVCSSVSLLFKKTNIYFVCLYPSAIIQFCRENCPLFPKGSVLIDISGVKESLVEDLAGYLNDHIDFVFTHPLAGSERSGVEYASPTLFRNHNLIITPTEKNKKENLELVSRLGEDAGFDNISFMSLKEHDELIAFTSQLMHVVSLALMDASPKRADIGSFIGDSFRDLTRIAMINENLWYELFIKNDQFLIQKIDDLVLSLNKYKEAIRNHDESELKKMMQSAKATRQAIERGLKE
ncbi:MAG: prephenate dehydrogenase [Candidatus Izemoplasmatales bacterium]|jgi:prephenate dehydrogenase